MSATLSLIPVTYYTNSVHWFNQLRDLDNPIWLDSGRPESEYGRYDILSAAPAITFKTQGDTTFIFEATTEIRSSENPFRLLKRYLSTSQPHSSVVPFCGGALGYFGYDLGRTLETFLSLAEKDISLPDMHVGIYPWAIIQDHQENKSWLVVNRRLYPAYDFSDIEARCSSTKQLELAATITQEINARSRFSVEKFSPQLSQADYQQAFKKIQHYIAAGDCYQVNFAQRFSANFSGSTLNAYLHLRKSLPSPFSAYMEFAGGAIMSLSPERFIKLTNNLAETKPIKGTIKRGTTPTEDRENAQWLSASIKNRAENVMIVDLLRNDLSKTCTDVKVPELFALQSFSNVHHLVSTVTGSLKSSYHPLDLLATCFPGGSITGAPKIRAMQIIEEMEPVRRSVYCGSIGYISACGNMDTNIAIRTLVCEKNTVHCWGGGGIVADSDMENEYQESITKVKILLDTLESING